ncbi:MAG: imidazole glycerol phosphate synthase subunit HisH [candidate division WOR-3 bacterium]
MIGIVDYGAGNLKSVKNAIDYLGFNARVVKRPDDISSVKRLILPGVGAFGSAVNKLKRSGLFETILNWLSDDLPFLGICLGLQLLFEKSEESGNAKGFGIFKGKIKRFRKYKVPQIGWNSVKILKPSPLTGFERKTQFFYFLHSYYLVTSQHNLVIGTSDYGAEYASIINQGNIYGVQFHPEKSGKNGLVLLKNWVEKC